MLKFFVWHKMSALHTFVTIKHGNTCRGALQNSFVSGLIALLSLLNLSTATFQQSQYSNGFQIAKQWKTFTYNFLPQAPVHDANFYNPSNILGTGLAVTRDRIFLSTPKLFSGVPSTVSWMSRKDFGDSPVLQAYPDWSFSTTGRTDFNCSDMVLVSSYRLRIDSCNRLWILDAGISRSLEDYEKTCPPKILVVDLNTDQVVRRVDFPSGILRGETLFTNLVIDETTSKSGTCDDVYAYISDTVEPGIIVYDSEHDTTWRLAHPAMYPDPDFSQAEILGDRFVLMDGIVGMTYDDKKAVLYFQPFATDRVFAITREVLRAGPIPINKVLPVKLLGKKSSQGIGLALSPLDRSLIFSPVTETAVASWNPSTNEQHILAQDQQAIQFVGDMFVSVDDPGYVYVLSSKFHRFFLKTLNTAEVNNRILRIPLPGSEKLDSVLPAYPIKSLDTPDLNFYYQISNDFPHKSSGRIASISPVQNYFTRPISVSKHPYRFESSGIVNYNVKNPFNNLNQGESFPPSKEQRSKTSYSWLDDLGAPPSIPTTSSVPIVSLGHSNGYYYHRP
ncbi:L-dopachrome tautomerase yellow-e isoform 1-T2 [Glossina fuscipes fuscipes]